MTIGGTDYYSDVTFDLSLMLGDDFRAQHAATVVKTNVSHLYPLGRKLVDLSYGRLVLEVTAQEPIKQFEPAMLPAQEQPAEPRARAISLDDLLDKAKEYGITEVHMSKAAARYCNGKRLEQLAPSEIEFLYNRLVESRGPDSAVEGPGDPGTRGDSSDRRSPAHEVTARAGQSRAAGRTPAAEETASPATSADYVDYAEYEESQEPATSGAKSNGRSRG